MPSAQSGSDLHRRIVRIWLLVVAALIFAVVVVGGATRLTESGLSIVEWKPVTGALPPLNEAAWQTAFEKYQTIPQYHQVNRGMSLDEFKVIYWWEWTHRLLGRLIGVAFLLPLVFFLWRGWIVAEMRGRLWFIFGLGALQGAVGWWMVASGLTERVNVSQYRLAFHLTLACVIFAAILWTAQRLAPPRTSHQAPGFARTGAIALLVLVICQIYLGALVAGSRAGLIYNTWPLIDGSWVPDPARLFFLDPWWRNFFENTLTVQFVHRMVAYCLWAAAMVYVGAVVWRASKAGRRAVSGAIALAFAVTLQAVFGILTLVHQVPIELGLLHQAMAVIVLALAVMQAEALVQRRHKQSTMSQPLAGAVR